MDIFTFPLHEQQKLRKLLTKGQVAAFREQTGNAYTLCGTVVEGNKVGRSLGYPTANLQTSDSSDILPAQGVYVAMVEHAGQWYQSMVNIGIRPTLDMNHVTVEAHLFNFNKNIYGEEICIAFLERIRDEMRFNSLKELKWQLDKDKKVAEKTLKAAKWS